MKYLRGINRLAQWVRQRAGFLREETSLRGSSQTIRTVETIESEERTVLIAGHHVVDIDVCPLCGSRLNPQTSQNSTHPQLNE